MHQSGQTNSNFCLRPHSSAESKLPHYRFPCLSLYSTCLIYIRVRLRCWLKWGKTSLFVNVCRSSNRVKCGILSSLFRNRNNLGPVLVAHRLTSSLCKSNSPQVEDDRHTKQVIVRRKEAGGRVIKWTFSLLFTAGNHSLLQQKPTLEIT